jgi:cytochrome c
MRSAPKLVASVSFALLAAASFAMQQSGDEVKGKDVFQRRCGGCHSLDRPMEGPRLRGVYGRRAGSTQDFQYSEALKNAKITWNEELLNKWLTDTESLVPDNDMSFRVPNPDERRDVIAYLKSLTQ